MAMKYKNPHKLILRLTERYWNRDQTDPWVRASFLSMLACRTEAKGGRVYASETEEKIFFNPCKSSACSSCGQRAGEKWRAERRAALPDILYHGVTFTMPNVLWRLFHDNPHLAKALPALAATALRTRARLKAGAEVGVVTILHTFNGKLEFNSHVHTIVTAGGLRGESWVENIYYGRNQLMEIWRKGVIRLLRAASEAGRLQTDLAKYEVKTLLVEQEKRWWSVKIQTLFSTKHFLEYAGRYVRRPPIAGYRITYIENGIVRFRYKDKRERRLVDITCSQEEFVDRWAQHILERYRHSVRNFGLFSPRAVGQTSAAILSLLGQKEKTRPKPRPWAQAVKQDFGHDPLVDSKGQRMRLVRLLPPVLKRT
jgi:Putative transposase/Transposase zinc-binding domain